MPLKASPEKIQITKMYERMQQRVMVDDPVLSKLIISLPRIIPSLFMILSDDRRH